MLTLVQKSLDDDKAQGTVTIDLFGKSDIADFLVITSGTSKRQVGAMAIHLRDRLKSSGIKGIAVEGMDQSDWVLIDAGDVIVHLFRPEAREFYNLEKMWSAPMSADGETPPDVLAKA